MLKTNVDLNNKTILVTGAAGFIGSNLVLELLRSYQNVHIVGIDNMNDYYDVSIKEYRIDLIEKLVVENSCQWTFIRGNIADKSFIDKIFTEYKPSVVVNFAAQAGVRYSISNPDVYIESNVIGFYNLLEACRNNPVEHLVYASSSSVYGSNKKVPYSIEDNVDNPVSLYAATKKSNELMAHAYSKLYNIPSTGLRFFTVYGPAGRPDMAYFSFTNKLLNGDKIQIFNYGNCKRDFTYVDDIVEGVKRVMQHAPEKKNGDDGLPLPPYKVYNIGNSNPENLLNFVDILQQELIRAGVLPSDYDFNAHKDLVPMQAGDVETTYADTSELEKDFGFKPATTLRDGLRKFAEWYKDFYKIKTKSDIQHVAEKVFLDLIRYNINGSELTEEIKNEITPEILPALFKLAKKHDLAHLVGDALDKNGLLIDDSKAKERFLQERNKAVFRFVQIQHEYEQICNIFEDAKIPFIPLKGSVVRSSYPEQWMRTSCDIDILVKEEDLSRAIKSLVDVLGYEEGEKCFHDVSLISQSKVHLELHYNLIEKDEKMDDLLSKVWDNVSAKEGSMMNLMNAPYLMFYLFAHMKHHFLKGGCGVRSFLDIHILLNNSKTDYSGFEELCEQAGILKFAQASISLANAWFANKDVELNKTMADFILSGGTYGQIDNKVILQQAKKGSKFKYILSRIWLPYEWLKYSYPSLEGKRWLTFFYQVHRWWSILTQKRVDKAVKEFKATNKIDKEKSECFAQLINELEL